MGEVSLHNSPSKEFRLFNTILECTIYWYIYLYVLYIAINISRITVDKYSGLLTIRGTSVSISTLLWALDAIGPKEPKWMEEETLILFLFHVIKIQTRWFKLHQVWSLFIHSLPFWILFFLIQDLRSGAWQGCNLCSSQWGGVLWLNNPEGRCLLLWKGTDV